MATLALALAACAAPAADPPALPAPLAADTAATVAIPHDAGTHIWRVDVQTGNVQRVTRPDR